MDYKIDDKNLDVSMFISFVNQVWQGNYDVEQTRMALSKTLNITAYDNKKLVGCLRILSDDYYFGTITELLVLPEYQHQGLASRLMEHLIADAQEKGREGLILTCKDRLIGFYERFGYKNLGLSQSVHGGAVWYDMILEFPREK